MNTSTLHAAPGLNTAPGSPTAPESQPTIPAQPNLPDYGFSALALFASYTRASYLAAFGVQAPNWDATKAPKAWFDTSGTSPSAYLAPNLLAASGSSAEQPLTVVDATTGQPRPLTLDQFHSFCREVWGGRPRPQTGPLAGLMARPGGRAQVRGPAPPQPRSILTMKPV